MKTMGLGDDEDPNRSFISDITWLRFSLEYILPFTSTKQSTQYGLPLYAHIPAASTSGCLEHFMVFPLLEPHLAAQKCDPLPRMTRPA
ncbi:MAG: hypothetical protein C4338_01405 [Rhodanobacteraceae bacterium]